jgi:DNA-binding sugar fermentation-stimulating protein
MPPKKKKHAAKKQLKSHIERGSSNNVVVSVPLVAYWFHIINTAAFKDELPTPDKIVVRKLNGKWGICEGSRKTKNCVITINSKIPNKTFFLATIAHEMVHHYQWVKTNDVNHGKTFKEWKEFFRKNFSISI